jgi:hypothetical protein
MTENPDKVLLAKILQKIEDSSLIPEKVLTRYRRSIMEGTMTTEDWCLLAEPADENRKDK